MKVVEFINRLNKIGFTGDTELTFSCVNGDTGEWYTLEPDTDEQDAFSYGEDLTGEPYCNDIIDFCLNVDDCKKYWNDKKVTLFDEFTEELNDVISKYERKILL